MRSILADDDEWCPKRRGTEGTANLGCNIVSRISELLGPRTDLVFEVSF